MRWECRMRANLFVLARFRRDKTDVLRMSDESLSICPCPSQKRYDRCVENAWWRPILRMSDKSLSICPCPLQKRCHRCVDKVCWGPIQVFLYDIGQVWTINLPRWMIRKNLRMHLRMKYGFAIYVPLSKKEYALFLFKEPYLKNAEAENYQKFFKNVS